jgi:hypothetical protein
MPTELPAAEPEFDKDGLEGFVDEPLDAGVAEAIPGPLNTAAPIPRAIARPPVRPMYLAAPIVFPFLWSSVNHETRLYSTSYMEPLDRWLHARHCVWRAVMH